ncbi:MAG: hypothetical protein V4613_12220 [Bacteroidota bacterium]
MKKQLILAFSFLVFLAPAVNAQMAFKKGCLLLSISEGSTTAKYSTTNTAQTTESPATQFSEMDGIRDPLFIEFGLSNRWGIGLSTGNDLFDVDPNKYYGFNLSDNKKVNVKTSEFTFDVNYHLYTRKRLDWSIYTSFGSFGVAFSGKDGDAAYNYKAKGGIIRVGSKLRYYFWKRLGVLGMVSQYSGTASTDGVKGNTVGTNTATTISGYALEFGLCFRFF